MPKTKLIIYRPTLLFVKLKFLRHSEFHMLRSSKNNNYWWCKEELFKQITFNLVLGIHVFLHSCLICCPVCILLGKEHCELQKARKFRTL